MAAIAATTAMMTTPRPAYNNVESDEPEAAVEDELVVGGMIVLELDDVVELELVA